MRPTPAPPDGLGRDARAAWAQLFAAPLAHRGLWSADGPPENTLAAFDAACSAGYGIELDVRLSGDGEAVVFHDDALGRLTGIDGLVHDHTADELARLRVATSEETIPTLAEVLAQVAGRAMLAIELKTPAGGEGPLERRVAELIDGYPGPVVVIGFNPQSLGWFAAERPDVLRGLDLKRDGPGGMDADVLAPQVVQMAQPHLLLPELALLGHPQVQAGAVVAWTARSPADAQRAADRADNIIFEGFRP